MSSSPENTLKYAIINLTKNKIAIETQSFDDPLFKQFLGGTGFAAHLLMKSMPPRTDPLTPASYLGIIPGVLTGTNVPFSGRFTVIGKSPLTGTWGEANSGGKFGPELRKTGFDMLFITGKATNLSIINIKDDFIEILESPELKSLDCVATEEKLKQKFGDKSQIASIGLAGENEVLITGIVTDKGRIAARSGMGAIMGSKNLKAIVARGTKDIFISKKDELREMRLFITKRINKPPNFLLKPSLKASTAFAPWIRRIGLKNFGAMSPNSIILEGFRKWGTAAGLAIAVETGDGPVKNWLGSHEDFPLKKSVKITSDNVTKYEVKKYGCKSCPLACGGIISFEKDGYNIPEAHKPEYETLAMLGSNLLNDDIGSIYYMNDYCNRQGLDTIAAGALLGFLTEIYQKGLVKDQLLDQIELDWGNSKAFEILLEKISTREGIGDILANGVGKAGEIFGEETKPYAIHIQNQALPAHDPRFNEKIYIPYKLDPAPGRHTPFMELLIDIAKFPQMFPELDKDNRIVDFYNYLQAFSTLGLCQFALNTGHFPAIEFLNLVTGLSLDIQEFLLVGERTLQLKHLFNLREGVNLLETEVPQRIVNPAPSGPNRKISLDEKDIISNFMAKMNWNDETLVPTSEKLKKLGIEGYLY